MYHVCWATDNFIMMFDTYDSHVVMYIYRVIAKKNARGSNSSLHWSMCYTVSTVNLLTVRNVDEADKAFIKAMS